MFLTHISNEVKIAAPSKYGGNIYVVAKNKSAAEFEVQRLILSGCKN
jgi:hypothetical protein